MLHLNNKLESCLCQKLTERIKIILAPEIELRGNAFKGDILWQFDFHQSGMICIGRHVVGHTIALQQGGQNYFLLISC